MLDYYIINDYLGSKAKKWYLYLRNSSYIYIKIVLSIIFFTIFHFLNLPLFDINFHDILDISLDMADKDQGINANIGTNSTVNINNPNISGKFSKQGINNVAAAISSAGGATVGLKTAQYVGGTPTTKLAVGLGMMLVVQGTTAGMSKILNYNKSNYGNKLVNHLTNDGVGNNDNNILNDYPLNLLVEVDLLLYAAILFLFIFINVYLANKLTQINYTQYLPKNRIGSLLNMFINRYINIWNKSKEFLLIISWMLLFISILLSKLYIYIILNYYG